MTEQAIIKMGLDSKDVEEGARRVSKAVQETGEHGHKSFVHAGTAARGFHHLLGEITQSSPILGAALRLAISPATGLFMAAAAGVGFLHEKLKEMSEGWNRVGEAFAKRGDSPAERMRETKKAVEELRLEQEKYARSLKTGPAEQIEKNLKESLGRLDAKAKGSAGDPAAIEKTRLQLKYKMEEDALKALSTARAKAVQDVETFERVQMTLTKDQRAQKAKELIEDEKRYRETSKQQLETTLKGLPPDWLAGTDDVKADLQHNFENAMKRSQSRQLAQERFLDDYGLRVKATGTSLEEAKARRAKLGTAFEGVDEQSAQTLRALKALPFQSINPMTATSISAMAGTQKIQDRIELWNQRVLQNKTNWDRDHGILVPSEQSMVGFSSRTGPERVTALLERILEKYDSGVVVFGKE